jgi:hypothetical protein
MILRLGASGILERCRQQRQIGIACEHSLCVTCRIATKYSFSARRRAICLVERRDACANCLNLARGTSRTRQTRRPGARLAGLALTVSCSLVESETTRTVPSPVKVPADVPASTRSFEACVKAHRGDVAPVLSSNARGVRLQVLVISADDVGTSRVKAGLTEGLVPCTEIDLNDPDRPTIDDAFLADGMRAKYQAVVLPSEAPPELTSAELDALAGFERAFEIRQFSSYVYPNRAASCTIVGGCSRTTPTSSTRASRSSAPSCCGRLVGSKRASM